MPFEHVSATRSDGKSSVCGEEFCIGGCVGFAWIDSRRNFASFALKERRIKTRPDLCKNEKCDMKNQQMKSSSQQQLDPNECGIILLRHNANSLYVC